MIDSELLQQDNEYFPCLSNLSMLRLIACPIHKTFSHPVKYSSWLVKNNLEMLNRQKELEILSRVLIKEPQFSLIIRPVG